MEKIKAIPDKRNELKEEIKKIGENGENLKGKGVELSATLKNLKKQENELLKAKGVCPVCESKLSDEKKANLLTQIDENAKKVMDELKRLDKEINEINLNQSKKEEILKNVEGIHYIFCARSNEKEVKKLARISLVKVNFANKRIVIEGMGFSIEEIKKKVKDLDYHIIKKIEISEIDFIDFNLSIYDLFCQFRNLNLDNLKKFERCLDYK